MNMHRAWWIGLVVSGTLASCDKGDAPAGMAAAKGDDAALFRDLPKGNQVLFGGNFMKMQKLFADSPLGKLSAAVNQQTPGMDQWQTCFIEGPGLVMAGGIHYAPEAVDLRYVMRGMDLAGIEACAKRASFAATVDPDHKFISIEIPTAAGPMKSGYFTLPDGALYARQGFPLGAIGLGASPTDRAALEADVASLKTGTAADDTALAAAIAKIDHSKAMWVVGSGAGTPVADKVGLVTMTLDFTDGFGIDVNADLVDAALADKIEQGVSGMKQQSGMFGPDVAAIVQNIHVDRTGNHIHGSVIVTNAQLKTLADKLGPMMQPK